MAENVTIIAAHYFEASIWQTYTSKTTITTQPAAAPSPATITTQPAAAPDPATVTKHGSWIKTLISTCHHRHHRQHRQHNNRIFRTIQTPALLQKGHIASTINVNFHHQIIYKHSDNCSTTLLHGIIATCTQIQGVRRNDAHSRIKQTVPPQISTHNRLLEKVNQKWQNGRLGQVYVYIQGWAANSCESRAGANFWSIDIVGLQDQPTLQLLPSLQSEQRADESNWAQFVSGTTLKHTR